MSTLSLYRPPLTRHLYRCRQYAEDGRLVVDRLLLAPSCLVASARFLVQCDRRFPLFDHPGLGRWWTDVTLEVLDWEIGERRHVDPGCRITRRLPADPDHRYTHTAIV